MLLEFGSHPNNRNVVACWYSADVHVIVFSGRRYGVTFLAIKYVNKKSRCFLKAKKSKIDYD